MKLPALLVCLKDLGTLPRTSTGTGHRRKNENRWGRMLNRVKTFGRKKTRREFYLCLINIFDIVKVFI